MDFTRAQQADFHPSICCVNNHGKRGCWNNSNILFKTFPSCYNANLMTLPITPPDSRPVVAGCFDLIQKHSHSPIFWPPKDLLLYSKNKYSNLAFLSSSSHDSHCVLHQQTDNCDRCPAAKTKRNGFSAVFHKPDDVRVQSDGGHGHDNEELAQRFERSKHRCAYAKGGADCGDQTGDNEP